MCPPYILMPKAKGTKKGSSLAEVLEALAPTEVKGKGPPGKNQAATSKRKATGNPNTARATKGGKKKEDKAAEEQAAAEDKEEEEEEEEEEVEARRSGLFLVTAVDLKKGTATGVMDDESIAVNIKATRGMGSAFAPGHVS